MISARTTIRRSACEPWNPHFLEPDFRPACCHSPVTPFFEIRHTIRVGYLKRDKTLAEHEGELGRADPSVVCVTTCHTMRRKPLEILDMWRIACVHP
jgi:hypothetical protein